MIDTNAMIASGEGLELRGQQLQRSQPRLGP